MLCMFCSIFSGMFGRLKLNFWSFQNFFTHFLEENIYGQKSGQNQRNIQKHISQMKTYPRCFSHWRFPFILQSAKCYSNMLRKQENYFLNISNMAGIQKSNILKNTFATYFQALGKNIGLFLDMLIYVKKYFRIFFQAWARIFGFPSIKRYSSIFLN